LSGQADAQGNIPLRLVSGQEVTLRPIATIRHFPTLTGSSFAVVDLDRLYSTLATVAPGLLEPNEAWLTVHRGTSDGSVLSALALAFGLAGGVVLTLLITSLVSVAANASVPLPPLQAVIPWGEAALVLVALALALIGLLTFQTLRAFRGESAGRLHG